MECYFNRVMGKAILGRLYLHEMVIFRPFQGFAKERGCGIPAAGCIALTHRHIFIGASHNLHVSAWDGVELEYT